MFTKPFQTVYEILLKIKHRMRKMMVQTKGDENYEKSKTNY